MATFFLHIRHRESFRPSHWLCKVSLQCHQLLLCVFGLGSRKDLLVNRASVSMAKLLLIVDILSIYL